MIKTFIQEREGSGSITLEQYNKEIEEAEAEIERGESFSQEEVLKFQTHCCMTNRKITWCKTGLLEKEVRVFRFRHRSRDTLQY